MYPFTSESLCTSTSGFIPEGECVLTSGPRRRDNEAMIMSMDSTKYLSGPNLQDDQSFTMMFYIKVEGIAGMYSRKAPGDKVLAS